MWRVKVCILQVLAILVINVFDGWEARSKTQFLYPEALSVLYMTVHCRYAFFCNAMNSVKVETELNVHELLMLDVM